MYSPIFVDEEQKSYVWFSKIKSSIFGNTYRVNHLKNHLKIRLTNVVQTFDGLKEIRIMVVELWQKYQPCVTRV